MKTLLALVITLVLATSIVFAGGNGSGCNGLIRLYPIDSSLDRDTPILGIWSNKVELDGYRGRIMMIGWGGKGLSIKPTDAMGKPYKKLKFIITPTAGLQYRQVFLRQEPGMDFICKQQIPNQQFLVDLQLCADGKPLWHRMIRLEFGTLKIYPKGPYDPNPYFTMLN